tara:strand:+ start:591 stop:1595 length:1005 start_codon:yes stop_codon:yes gene_type:complete
MRLFSSSLFSLFLSFSLFGQNSYELIILEEIYHPLEKAILIDSSSFDYENGWDDPEFSVPIGFTFSFLGNEIETLDQVGLGSLIAGTPSSGVPLFYGLMPVSFDLADRGLVEEEPSLIRYQTTGMPGERVFAIEWYNAGLYEEVFKTDSSATESSLNFQIWLYENDYVIEFRYGSCIYPDPFDPFSEPGLAAIFLDFNPSSFQGDILTLSGHPAFCILENVNSVDDLEMFNLDYYLNSMVYRFQPTSIPSSINENKLISSSIYPNPTCSILTVDLDDLKGVKTIIKLYDSSSKLVFEKEATSTLMIDVSGFTSGRYLLELSTNEQVLRSQVIVD